MSSKIRWGIIGTGTVASNFAADFVHTTDSELVAITSRNLDRAKSFASKLGAPQAYDNYAEMLANGSVDIVYIATPHHRHKADCLQAFEAGKAVLCEKPFTLNSNEAKSIISAAKKHNVFCMEAMWMRCMPLIQKAKQHIEQGDIGKLQHIRAEFGYPAEFSPDSRFYDLEQGGGSLLDRGIYTIALAFHMLGKPVKISGDARIGTTGVDESSCYQLTFENGTTAELCSTLRGYASNEAILSGGEGYLKLHAPFYRPEHLSMHTGSPPTTGSVSAGCDSFKTNKIIQKLKRVLDPIASRLSSGQHHLEKIPGNGYQFEIDEASQCLQQGLKESPLVPLADSLAILETMDELRLQWGLKYPQET